MRLYVPCLCIKEGESRGWKLNGMLMFITCLRNELRSSERRVFDKKRGRGLRQNFIPKISNLDDPC